MALSDIDKFSAQLQHAAAVIFGLTDVTPVILSRGGNVIVHLAPHHIVARVAAIPIADQQDHHICMKLEQELHVASHLYKQGIPVLRPVFLAGKEHISWMGTG